MKELTKSQLNDIELCMFFCPHGMKRDPTEQEIIEFLDLSERGIGKDRGKFSKNPIIVGKTRRGLSMSLWEEGVLEWNIPYYTLLGGCEETRKWWNPMRWIKGRFYNIPIPRTIVDFMKKEMFRGMDAEIIETTYGWVKNEL